MKTIQALSIAFCLIGFVASGAHAQTVSKTEVSGVGTNAATFLEIGVGARAMAMGGTYVAIADDPTALYYNPAGIPRINGIQIEATHNEWLVDTKHDFLGVVVPLPFLDSAFGLSIVSLDYGRQPVRTAERPEGNGQTYGARDLAFALTYGIALTDRFSFGMSGKYIRQKIFSESGSAAGIDLGIFYESKIKGLRLGFSMSNFGTNLRFRGRQLNSTTDPDLENQNVDRVPVTYNTEAYPLPLLFRVGIAYERQLGELGALTLAGDVSHPSHATESVNLGIEYGFGGMLYLRAGYENLYEEDSINGLTYGGGIDYYKPGQMGVRVDYAYSDWGILDNSHRFSLGVAFPR